VKTPFCLTVMHLLVAFFCFAGEPPLRIVDAGIQVAEDGPFVAGNYAFMPGEPVYFSFQVAGYQIERSSPETRRVKLDFTIQLADGEGTLLTPPVTGRVEEELNDEDKDWLPKRRAVLQLPPYIAFGDARLTISLTDLVAHVTVSRTLPLRLGGEKLLPSATLEIQAFRFYRSDDDREPIQVAAYRPGDIVWTRFDVTGFKAGPKNSHRVEYGLQVIAPDGHAALVQELASEGDSESFYPPPFIPGTLSLPTRPDMSAGQYTIVLTARDMVGKQSFTGRYGFTLE
jgi:hypothetical protein